LFLLSRACCQARDGASHFFLYTSTVMIENDTKKLS
jgi:hypothetical protein